MVSTRKGKKISSAKALVYVALGANFDNLLEDFSYFASKNYPGALVILITDMPKKYSNFCGTIIDYQRTAKTEKTMKYLHLKRPELKGIAKEYWFLTFERLLALECLEKILDSETTVIHLESDILSFISDSMVEAMKSSLSKVSYLRWSKYANAGVLFSPSNSKLQEFVCSLHELVLGQVTYKSWSIDMEILEEALSQKIADELPTVRGIDEFGRLLLSKNIILEKKRILCDSLDLGVYLFGRNSIYSKGIISGGYRFPHINWPIESSNWKFSVDGDNIGETPNLLMRLGNEEFIIPFLHINSKINLVQNSFGNLRALVTINRWVKGTNFMESGIKSPTVHNQRSLKFHLNRIIHRFSQ